MVVLCIARWATIAVVSELCNRITAAKINKDRIRSDCFDEDADEYSR